MNKLFRPFPFLFFVIPLLFCGLSLSGQTGQTQEEQGQAPDSASAVPAEDAAEPGRADAGLDEAGEQPAAEPDMAAAKQSAEDSILEMDIRTSSLFELAAWCRSLGLSESGGKEELAGRLRSHFNLSVPVRDPPEGGEEGSKQKTIIIESARSTEYFTLEAVDEEYARLRGDVLVSLKDGEVVHRIQAWEILYNRTRNSLSASGGVEYEKVDGDTRETFRGESITVNLDTWATVFMGGVSERSISNEETAYRFSGTLITRSDEEVTILTRSKITNANTDEPYWSLSASKLWLLPGSDFAIMNAILKVGEIPVLYIPFFFFPTSEIIFHPVVGTRSREGAFFQTTTYVLGRPVASSTSESSITRILGNSTDNEKVREGVFLRSTGRKVRDPNDTRLSLLFDAYANLGYYLGTELALPQKGVFGVQDFSLGIGLTQTVFRNQEHNYYSPFEKGEIQWNSSRFFSDTIPLRYRFNSGGSLKGKYGSMTWALPFYSDPYVNRDFMNRSEEMDWVKLLKAETDATTDEYRTNRLGTYEWRLSGSLTPVINLQPYITSLSLSSISSTLAFQTRQTAATVDMEDPNYYFFFPDKFTIASISGSIQGTPFSLGGSGGTTVPENQEEQAADPLRNIGVPYPPWEQAGEAESATETSPWYELVPPVLNQRFDLPKASGPHFTIDYRLGPSTASELQFRSSQAHWSEVEKVDWGEMSSILTTLKTDAGTTFKLTDDNTGAYTISARLFGNATWQDYSMINEEAEEFDTQQKKDSAYQRVRNQTFFTTSSELITTVKPLYWDPIWGNSNLQYTLRNLFVKSVFNNSIDDPKWDLVYAKWDRDSLDAHQFSANIAASVMDKVQNFSFVSDLPPEDPTITANVILRAWITETNAKQKILDPGGNRKFEPFTFTETLNFAANYSAQQYFAYDPEKNEFTSLTSTLTLRKFIASFTAIRSRTYDLIPGQGWITAPGDETFNPKEFKLTFSPEFKKDKLWNDRLSFKLSLNTGLAFDLQRYTASKFNFSLGFTLGLSKFVDFSLNTSSENAVIF
ncbi:MAG: LPS-assembly protein LptD, partial [Treponema sp.]|nr:LPS-assembly protein LptD [Treponema sp.]